MPEGEVQSISYLSPALKQNIPSGREHFVLAVNIVGRKRIVQFELAAVMEEHMCVCVLVRQTSPQTCIYAVHLHYVHVVR